MSPWIERWTRLEKTARRHFSAEDLALNAGAPDAAIDAARRALPASIPEDFWDCYRVHDGQSADHEQGLIHGWSMMSLEDVVASWSSWRGLEHEIEADSFVSIGPVREQYGCPGWIPIADDAGGNCVGIDVDPGPGGVVGQFIPFGRDIHHKQVLEPSLADYFDRVIRALDDDENPFDETHGSPAQAAGFYGPDQLAPDLNRWQRIVRYQLRTLVRESNLTEASRLVVEAIAIADRVFPRDHWNHRNTLEMRDLIALRVAAPGAR